MNLSWLKLLQSCSKQLNLLLGEFLKISGAKRNWGRWSDIVAIVFELEVTLVGWMFGRNIDEARDSKNSLVGECCSYFERSTL